MNRKFLVTALILIAACRLAWGDAGVESAQRKLKDGGFYYGEINGKKDADTTAAIRRYQIRNGLQITGELNAETLHSLGLGSKPSSTPAPRPAHTPGPTPPPGFLEETPAPTIAPAPRQQPPRQPQQQPPPQQPNDNGDDYAPAPPPPQPRVESGSLFGGTPYEAAPPQVQQDLVARAQIILMRRGYYRSGIDGRFGPAMDFALRNYQARFGLRPTGRFDVETLAALGLLPEQRMSSPRRFHRHFFPPARLGPGNEPIYIPR
ncbi:MAG TPA: peptidoglycan-binding domain-containing protein [Chthoniobacterales bacterium]|nr:peptidoglycan-binding domain-containing protein [Chthoniobacterales bacterium]